MEDKDWRRVWLKEGENIEDRTNIETFESRYSYIGIGIKSKSNAGSVE